MSKENCLQNSALCLCPRSRLFCFRLSILVVLSLPIVLSLCCAVCHSLCCYMSFLCCQCLFVLLTFSFCGAAYSLCCHVRTVG